MSDTIYSYATAVPSVAGSSRMEALVILAVEAYRPGPAGPEVEVIATTPYRDSVRMTLPASALEVYTIWLDD